MSSDSTCRLNGFGYRVQKALVTWFQLNLKMPKYRQMLFIPVAKAFNKFQGEYHLLEQAIRAVELHRVCRSYKYFERNRLMPGLPRQRYPVSARSQFNRAKTGFERASKRRRSCYLNSINYIFSKWYTISEFSWRYRLKGV